MLRSLVLTFILTLLLAIPLDAQVNITDSIPLQGFQRKYITHLPPSFSPTDTIPLVIVLHGGSGDALSVQNFTMMNPVSNANGFLTVYPEGIGPVSGGGFSWADGRGTSADSMMVDDVGFLTQLIDTLKVNYPIDAERVYLRGFSNGAFMTQLLACDANEDFAAIASLGSTMDTALFSRCQPGRLLPTLILTATLDPFVPYNGGPMNGNVTDIVSTDALVQFWQQINNCQTVLDSVNLPDTDTTDNSTVTVFEYTDCDCDGKVVHYRINEAGHTWPGVEIPNYELIAGETNEDIQASEEIWQFFSQFERCANVPLGVREQELSSVKWSSFPNPIQDELKVMAEEEIEQVQLWNLQGQLAGEIKGVGFQTIISTSTLPSGSYVLKVRFVSGLQDARLLLKP